MALDKKTVQLVEKTATESINKLRKVTEEEVAKLMKRSESAADEEGRIRLFNRALAVARKTEQVIAEIETQVAAIANPWHAKPPTQKRTPIKR